MRMSCNGCRVLRKGCSDDCTIRPCLQWIQSPESQANATVFLAKFYGRAGLMNLINVGPQHLRPALFRSLLYEACGRIVNPIYGSVGLLWSGRWELCQNAVEAVLKGSPIVQVDSDAAETSDGPPLKAYDIRHVSKDDNSGGSTELHRIRTRCRFKRSGSKTKTKSNTKTNMNRNLVGSCDEDDSGHESTLSHQSEAVEGESQVTVDTAEGVAGAPVRDEKNDGVELELTLGFEPVHRCRNRSFEMTGKVAGGCGGSGNVVELGLDYRV